ncbi:hypothetical protein Hanom_Chr14g01269261 [Helianthus anomalus]
MFVALKFSNRSYELYSSFLIVRNEVSTIVTPGVVAKVDYSTVVSALALPDMQKPNLYPPEGTTVK